MNLDEYGQDLALLNASERFVYLIELGDELEQYPQERMDSEHEVPGCTSRVYVCADMHEDKLFFSGYAEAKVVRGYVKILIDALSAKTPEEVLHDTSVQQFITDAKMGVSTQVSRANAFANIYAFMKRQAKQFKGQDAK